MNSEMISMNLAFAGSTEDGRLEGFTEGRSDGINECCMEGVVDGCVEDSTVGCSDDNSVDGCSNGIASFSAVSSVDFFLEIRSEVVEKIVKKIPIINTNITKPTLEIDQRRFLCDIDSEFDDVSWIDSTWIAWTGSSTRTASTIMSV
mmetsp:Transcript_7293/g.9718  ORF Transcript_7293/g.9718 Transcript_7293/m.9718 type:complete len:147 (+) Transcript_7293:305-745(+)